MKKGNLSSLLKKQQWPEKGTSGGKKKKTGKIPINKKNCGKGRRSWVGGTQCRKKEKKVGGVEGGQKKFDELRKVPAVEEKREPIIIKGDQIS